MISVRWRKVPPEPVKAPTLMRSNSRRSWGPGGVAGAFSDVGQQQGQRPIRRARARYTTRHRPSYPSAIVRTGRRTPRPSSPAPYPQATRSADHAAQGPAASHTIASPTQPNDTQNGHSSVQSTVDRAGGPAEHSERPHVVVSDSVIWLSAGVFVGSHRVWPAGMPLTPQLARCRETLSCRARLILMAIFGCRVQFGVATASALACAPPPPRHAAPFTGRQGIPLRTGGGRLSPAALRPAG